MVLPHSLSPKVFHFTNTSHNDTYPEIDPTCQSDCSGKAVLVTGANKGLGRAYLIAYAKAGASYIAIGTRSDVTDLVTMVLAAAAQSGRKEPVVIQVKIDVCEQVSIDAAVDQVQSEFSRLDILINNSGFMGQAAPLFDLPSDIFQHTWDVNFLGSYRVTKAFLPLLLAEGDKTIVFSTSIAAQFIERETAAYSVSKFALCRLSEFIDAEYGEKGVLTYSFHPGGVVTDLALNLPEHVQSSLTDTAELSADTLIYLTSKKRSWLAGRYVSANWDMPELMAQEEEIVRDGLLKFRCATG